MRRAAAAPSGWSPGSPRPERPAEPLATEGIETEIDLRRVESSETAESEHFLGSPTVRVDGEDVDPSANGRTDFGLKCRLYRSTEGTSGVPPEQWITAALRGTPRQA